MLLELTIQFHVAEPFSNLKMVNLCYIVGIIDTVGIINTVGIIDYQLNQLFLLDKYKTLAGSITMQFKQEFFVSNP